MEDKQLVMRRVYDDNNVLIREQLTPKDVKNTRDELMAYWSEQDRLAAEVEAAEAQAELERIEALEQNPPEAQGAMALAALSQRIDELEPLVEEVRGLSLATPEEVLRGAAQIARVAGLASEIESVAVSAMNRVDEVARGASDRLESLDGRLSEIVRTAGDVVTDCRQMVEKNSAAAMAKVTDSISKRIAGLEVQAAQLKGPRGPQGAPGVSIVVGAGKPQGASALEPLIGRGAIVGDVYIDASDDSRRAYRWDGEKFEAGPSFVSTITRDVKISALDASTKTYPTVTILGGSGSGNGADPISARSVSPNIPVQICDTSRWQIGGFGVFKSGTLSLEIVAFDGLFAGRTNFLTASFTIGAGGADPIRFTESAVLGDLLKGNPIPVDVVLTGQLGPATIPTVIGGTPPSGTAQATALFIELRGPGGGATNYFLKGAISWALDPVSTPAPNSQTPTARPAWQIV